MTATVLHAGLVHLGFNMWVLWDAGRIAERFYGSLQFLLIYLISGLFGSLASLFFAARTGVSVGASGAIFGVVGALLAALFTKQSKLPPGLAASMRSSMLLFVGYSLFMGFISSFIDNAAHIGGLVSGFAAAVILAERFDWEEYRRSAVQRSILAIGAAMVAAFVIWKLVPVPVA
jgi:rhomboid protease GluP